MERTIVIQAREAGRDDILGEVYRPSYGPGQPANVPGRDLGDYDLKIVVINKELLVIEGEPHRRLLDLVEGGRWERLKVVCDGRDHRPKLLAFTWPAAYPAGTVGRFVML